jgi:hypothetical protein
LALSGLSLLLLNFFLWQAFKTFKSERRVDNADVTDFQEENSKLYSGTSKGLAPSTTPFKREGLFRIVESNIPKVIILSIEKCDCENYLFEGYYLKSCIKGVIWGITISGRSIRELMESFFSKFTSRKSDFSTYSSLLTNLKQ